MSKESYRGILKSFSLIFVRDCDILRKRCHCSIASKYDLEDAAIILRLSLLWINANILEFWKLDVWLVL